MMPTFIDTSFLIALVIENDELHTHAVAWRKALGGSFLITEFVLLEVCDSLAKPTRRSFARDIVTDVRDDPGIEIVPLSSELLARGYRLFLERQDQEWSLTDCTSFLVLQDRQIRDALTYDHHFEQAGFRALLRHDPPGN